MEELQASGTLTLLEQRSVRHRTPRSFLNACEAPLAAPLAEPEVTLPARLSSSRGAAANVAATHAIVDGRLRLASICPATNPYAGLHPDTRVEDTLGTNPAECFHGRWALIGVNT